MIGMDYRGMFEEAVDALRQEKRYRVFADLERIAGRFPRAVFRDTADNAREITIWCSNDYLGMGQHPKTIAAMQEAAEKLGVGAGGTRNISGTNRPLVELERSLADLHRKEAALVFTSGFVSNEAAISTIARLMPDCLILSDQLNHASMIQGVRQSGMEKKIFRHNDIAHLRELLAATERKRPKLIWFNLALTLALVVGLVSGAAPLPVLMMGAFAIAAIVNYPDIPTQRTRVAAHAKNVLGVVLLIFAAGGFTGILSGTGMVKAMADATLTAIPPQMGPYLAPITALLSMPMTFFMSNDAFYFGVLPVIAETHARLGGAPVQVAQAALVGQMTAGFPVSPLTPATFLVAGLAGVELSAHQKFAFPLLYGASLVMAIACLLLGLFPL